MSYKCKILLDSISETGKRLTTMETTFPRIVLAEFNTHRMFSRNSASSRAIPFEKQITRLHDNPFIPEQFPLNCSGMQPQEYVTKDDDRYEAIRNFWLVIRDEAITNARLFYQHKIHKQICNRLLEPFMWHTVIVTATEWDNFFKLRCDENAQYEIKRIADLMYEAYHAYEYDPELAEDMKAVQKLKVGEWHCPLVNSNEDDLAIRAYIATRPNPILSSNPNWSNYYLEIKKKISVARCARVSYLTHDGKRDIEKDLELFERLRTSGHWSPFEHVATPYFADFGSNLIGSFNEEEWGSKFFHNERYMNIRSGNFIGWKQYRKEFKDENCTNFRKEN